jgi:hypothetical protein
MGTNRKQIEARIELHRRISQTLQSLEGWGMPEHDPLAHDTPADTRILFNEARDLLGRLKALTDRDIDAAIAGE